MAVRVKVFREVGALDEKLVVGCNDVDFCLKVKEKGYRNVWTPFAELLHHESVSRGLDDTPAKRHRSYQEMSLMRKRWPHEFFHDAAYNPNLSYNSHHFEVSRNPRISEGLLSVSRTQLPRLLIVSEKFKSCKLARLILLAESLVRQRLIDSFALADKKGFVRFSSGFRDGFEMIVVHGNLRGSWVEQEIMKPCAYLADWDEIAVEDRSAGELAVSRALVFSAAIAVTHSRLAQQIEEVFALNLDSHLRVVPEGVFYRFPLVPAGGIRGLVWVYDSTTPLGDSTDAIVAAIEQFSRKYRLPVYGFGDFPKTIRSALSRGVWKKRGYWEFLQKNRHLIGLEPLEISTNELLGNRITAKSDIRMAEYGGLGIPAVYSAAVPYAESDLKTGRLVENTTTAWLAAMEELLELGPAAEDENAAKIRRMRDIDRISRECWWPALEKVRLQQSFPVSWIGR